MERRPTRSPARTPADRAGWSFVLGSALVAVGLIAPSAQTTQGGGPISPSSATAYVPPSFAASSSNGSMISVSAVDITGASLLYVVDSDTRQLSVYQATGGSSSTSGLRWIGARRIDLDLQVDGWNDKSEHGYKDLRSEFEENGVLRSNADR